MTDLSKNIQRLRHAKNLKPAELAGLLQVTAETVVDWERSDTIPSIDQLPAIAEALGTDVVTLLYPVADPVTNAEKEPFRPGCGFVFASAVFYCFLIFVLASFLGELAFFLAIIIFMAICTCIIVSVVHEK